jgi:hypothetical protein
MLVLVVISRESFDSGHFELFNFPGRWLLRPAFFAGIKPCDVIMHKVYWLAIRCFCLANSRLPTVIIHTEGVLQISWAHGVASLRRMEKFQKYCNLPCLTFPLGNFLSLLSEPEAARRLRASNFRLMSSLRMPWPAEPCDNLRTACFFYKINCEVKL